MNENKKWCVASATARGRGHIKHGVPCQDKVAEYVTNHSSGVFYGVALADGAGSCKFSDKGAEFISNTILKKIQSEFKKTYDSKKLTEILTGYIEKELKLFSEKKKINMKDLSSTLLFVVMKNNKFIIGHIGDGVIGGLMNNGRIHVLSEPENGEFHNSTYFTTSKNNKHRLRIKKGTVKEIIGFILMSDGTSESLYDHNEKKLTKANINIINWLTMGSKNEVDNALSKNLSNLIVKKTLDDCSIAIMRKK
jgi:serine/threonine protein phosphatase PrpC